MELLDLPPELLKIVLSYMPGDSRVSLSKTCRQLQNFIWNLEKRKPGLRIFVTGVYFGVERPRPFWYQMRIAEGEEDFQNALPNVVHPILGHVLDKIEELTTRNCNIVEFSLGVFRNSMWLKGPDVPPFPDEIDLGLSSIFKTVVNSCMFPSQLTAAVKIPLVDVPEECLEMPYFLWRHVGGTTYQNFLPFFENCPSLVQYFIGICDENVFPFISVNQPRFENVTVQVSTSHPNRDGTVGLPYRLEVYVQNALSGVSFNDYGTGVKPQPPSRTRFIFTGDETEIMKGRKMLVSLGEMFKDKYTYIRGSNDQRSSIESAVGRVCWDHVYGVHLDVLVERKKPTTSTA